MIIHKKWLGKFLIIVSMLVLTGCRQDPQAIFKKFSEEIKLGMTRNEVETKLGSLGKREFLCEEKTRHFYIPGWTKAQLRDNLISYRKAHPLYMNPPDILETFPMEDGAAILVHYAFARDFRFAVGCNFLALTLFYDGKTNLLTGIYFYDSIIWNHPDFDTACRGLKKEEALWFK